MSATTRIQATDGEIGHVDDFIVDDDAWTIRYMVIDTGDWLPGKKSWWRRNGLRTWIGKIPTST